ncbi:hypothetical protein RIF25_12500 [Thermosynechococcaceae cyanobacterium BACA0444]|uniref:Glycine zipper domain-containing protein n=1 Tax=Pseudocalidococcus azoricus BACA0444 TaxID=2918990 RepID=A0AAE4JX07_9CYAN|nr:hypothetical protein [Pseudocalidococcus azoricus]MDS3861626.1 hypothetical protein [Pseudocalidococcus azoricus BACA0444]
MSSTSPSSSQPPPGPAPLIPAELVHLTKDRMRLKIPHLRQDPSYGEFLQTQLQTQAGICAIHLNLAAQSFTIHWNPQILCLQQLFSQLQTIGDLEVSGQGYQGWTNLTRAFALEPAQVSDQAQNIGSFIVGGQVGDVVGGLAGGAVGGATLGPAGVVVGTQVGTFVGGVVGARICVEALQTLKEHPSDLEKICLEKTEEKVAQSLKIRTSSKAGEVTGEITGGLVGGALLGPPGEIIGQMMGNMVGGQIAEDAARQVISPDPKPDTTAPTSSSVNIVLEWWMKTSRAFVGETALATLGGLLMRLILGPQAEAVGLKAGSRAGRIIDWNTESASCKQPQSNQAKTEEL